MMAAMNQWVAHNIRSSGWLLCAPLVAAYAPRGLPQMYINRYLRLYAGRLIPLLDPFVTIDIVSKSSRSTGGSLKSSIAYEEVKAYLTSKCSRDALEFCAEGAVKGDNFSLSLREGQEVTDHFDGVTVWWYLVQPPKDGYRSDRVYCLRLMFPQKHRRLIEDEYLPHVRRSGRELTFITIDINKKSSSCNDQLKSNDAYEEVKAYLSSACSRDVIDLCAEGAVKGDSFLLSLRDGQEVTDQFNGVTLWWLSVESCLRLILPQGHRRLILDEYLPHVRRQGRDLMFGKRSQRLYTNKRGRTLFGSDEVWSHIDFEHPATFDTLAMHPDKKRRIKEDLDSFSRNKDYYRRIGKPWKRGYLLYGPPGTGKSSMIAAMANYLNYDIYDIELTTVDSNSDLRKLFIETTGKSIIVIEDIDCSLDNLTGQRSNQKKKSKGSDDDDGSSKVTLSGLLNFLDGVWSAQSGERIIVLTTNFKDKLDQALIRRGRMDFHVEMSYCGFEAFKTLARNYLGVKGHHRLFGTVEELLQVVKITPADVAECLLPSQADVTDHDVEICIGRLIDELQKKKAEEDHKVEDKTAAKPKRQRRHK